MLRSASQISFAGRVVAREVPPRLDDLAQLALMLSIALVV
jgi:hypothetical protein